MRFSDYNIFFGVYIIKLAFATSITKKETIINTGRVMLFYVLSHFIGVSKNGQTKKAHNMHILYLVFPSQVHILFIAFLYT